MSPDGFLIGVQGVIADRLLFHSSRMEEGDEWHDRREREMAAPRVGCLAPPTEDVSASPLPQSTGAAPEKSGRSVFVARVLDWRGYTSVDTAVSNGAVGWAPKLWRRPGNGAPVRPPRLWHMPPRWFRTRPGRNGTSLRPAPGGRAVSEAGCGHVREADDRLDVHVPSEPPELTVDAARALLRLVQNVAQRRSRMRASEPDARRAA